MIELLQEAEFWVAVAFVIFIALIWRAGAFRGLATALDHRAERIKNELDEAARLRADAQALLADADRRRRDAESEAAEIVSTARSEAERVAAEAHSKAEEFVARRTKMAETKIAQAEAQALTEVRSAATDAAVAAAGKILAGMASGKVADDLIARGINDIKAKLN
jgi:F-type H+-transporting ATPase subunit b